MTRRRPPLLVLALLVAAEALTREKAKEGKLCRKVTKRKTKYESASEKYERMFEAPCEAVAVEACAVGFYRAYPGEECEQVSCEHDCDHTKGAKWNADRLKCEGEYDQSVIANLETQMHALQNMNTELQVALATAVQEKAALQTEVAELKACTDTEGGCEQYPTLQEAIVPIEKTCQRCRWWNSNPANPECEDALSQTCDGW